MSGYSWTISPGGTITWGLGTNYVEVTWNASGAQWIAVTYNSPAGCSPTTPTQYNVMVNPLPGAAGTITGTATVCGGTNGVVYTVGMIPDAFTYVWILPVGATIASGAGTSTITVDFGPYALSGPITVFGNNLCGSGAVSPPFQVTVNPLPDTAGVISGPASVCQGVTGTVYSIAPINNATGYVWTVPAGANIANGQNTTSIIVDFTTSAVSGLITVYGTNSCGNGPTGPEFQVTVNPIPPTPIVTVIDDIILHSNIPTGNLWYYQGAPAPPPNNGQEYTATRSGEYWCVVTWNGCSSDTSNHVWIVMPGIETMPENASFNVYPVPNDGRFTASIAYPTTETFTIKVYNQLGVVIHEVKAFEVNGTATRQIDLRPTPAGIYSVVFETGSKRMVRKILITR